MSLEGRVEPADVFGLRAVVADGFLAELLAQSDEQLVDWNDLLDPVNRPCQVGRTHLAAEDNDPDIFQRFEDGLVRQLFQPRLGADDGGERLARSFVPLVRLEIEPRVAVGTELTVRFGAVIGAQNVGCHRPLALFARRGLTLSRVVFGEAQFVARHHANNSIYKRGFPRTRFATEQHDLRQLHIADRQLAPIDGRHLLHDHRAASISVPSTSTKGSAKSSELRAD